LTLLASASFKTLFCILPAQDQVEKSTAKTKSQK
jgi:hypothetical protein